MVLLTAQTLRILIILKHIEKILKCQTFGMDVFVKLSV